MLNIVEICGHCSRETALKIVSINTKQLNSHYKIEKLEASRTDRDSSISASRAALVECPLCQNFSLVNFFSNEFYFQKFKSYIKDTNSRCTDIHEFSFDTIYPSAPSAANHRFWPEELIQPFLDAQTMVRNASTPAFALTSIRTVLEAATRLLHTPDKGNLKTKIDFLRENGTITEGMKTWAHDLRLDGNRGTHELGGNILEARANLSFLRQFLDLCFTLPATIERKKTDAKTVADSE
ncbi:MAG: DUF4145 domain-containing protein [Hyphomicrobiales bacterium]